MEEETEECLVWVHERFESLRGSESSSVTPFDRSDKSLGAFSPDSAVDEVLDSFVEGAMVSSSISLGDSIVVSSKPESDLVHESWRSGLNFAVGFVAMVAKYGVHLISGQVIKIWLGDQVRTDCPGGDAMVGCGDSEGVASISLFTFELDP